MKSTWFGDRKRYEFALCLADADHGNQSWDNMNCFLTAATGAFRQACRMAIGCPMDDAIEQEVIKSQKRVKRPEKLAECLAILTAGLEENPYDFLGTTLAELSQLDVAWKGQCFTPPALCTLMAQVTLGDAKPDPSQRMLLHEPAVGGGATVIAASNVLKENGFFPWNYHWTCVDVDWRMFAISYIQLTLLGIPAGVIHGNTISMQQWDGANTLTAVLHPLRERKPVESDIADEITIDEPEAVEEAVELPLDPLAAPSIEMIQYHQPSLF